MKIQYGILLIGALVLVSGCARKCPPCPVSTPVSYGSTSYSAPASMTPSSSYSAPSDQGSVYGSASGNRYTNK